MDLYKIQQKAEQPRRMKNRKKAPGFAAQKKALESTGYLAKSGRTKKKKS